MQETFLRGHSKLGDLRGPARLGAWTSAIAANVLADHRRQRTRQRVEGSSEEEVMADSAAVPNADENLNAIVAGWVQSFLEQLDPGDAALLRAVELDSRSQAEVARELGLPPAERGLGSSVREPGCGNAWRHVAASVSTRRAT